MGECGILGRGGVKMWDIYVRIPAEISLKHLFVIFSIVPLDVRVCWDSQQKDLLQFYPSSTRLLF